MKAKDLTIVYSNELLRKCIEKIKYKKCPCLVDYEYLIFDLSLSDLNIITSNVIKKLEEAGYTAKTYYEYIKIDNPEKD